jgi:hypothetical protein
MPAARVKSGFAAAAAAPRAIRELHVAKFVRNR